MTQAPTTAALAPWFGSNRMLASTVGQQLGKCAWVGVPFAGGCCEVPYIKTRAGVANDLHRHLINLARVVADPESRCALIESLERTLFHADEYEAAKLRCADREAMMSPGLFGGGDKPGEGDPTFSDIRWARDYFIVCWMGPSARAGTTTEFGGYFSVRWTSSGGDSAVRFRSAIASLDAWHKALSGWTFTTVDAFEFLDKCRDEAGHAVYADSPWPVAGKEYRHGMSDGQLRRLAVALERFEKARVVVRYGDDPLIRELYPEGKWTWVRQSSRDQNNEELGEVLILNGPSYTEGK